MGEFKSLFYFVASLLFGPNKCIPKKSSDLQHNQPNQLVSVVVNKDGSLCVLSRLDVVLQKPAPGRRKLLERLHPPVWPVRG